MQSLLLLSVVEVQQLSALYILKNFLWNTTILNHSFVCTIITLYKSPPDLSPFIHRSPYLSLFLQIQQPHPHPHPQDPSPLFLHLICSTLTQRKSSSLPSLQIQHPNPHPQGLYSHSPFSVQHCTLTHRIPTLTLPSVYNTLSSSKGVPILTFLKSVAPSSTGVPPPTSLSMVTPHIYPSLLDLSRVHPCPFSKTHPSVWNTTVSAWDAEDAVESVERASASSSRSSVIRISTSCLPRKIIEDALNFLVQFNLLNSGQ